MSIEAATLYVVATPIGNLGDWTARAREVVAAVDVVAAEDTRHTAALLAHFGIRAQLLSLHEHNEEARIHTLLERLRGGASVALVSDAGTPLISDPGYRLVAAVRAAGLRVTPVPGPSALTAALSVSGLPTDRFVFEGFLPARSASRRERLTAIAGETRTLVFYESAHRIHDSLHDMAEVFGPAREAVVARELTKAFEEIAADCLGGLLNWIVGNEYRQKGEFVVLVHGAEPVERELLDDRDLRTLTTLAAELPLKQAVRLATAITGRPKNLLYERALQLRSESPTEE